jgi:3' exoribonuclease, RNase T-like
MYRCMLDFETLGTRPGCCVLTFGAVFFSSTEAEPLGQEFSAVVNVKSQEALGLHVDQDTVAWWERQSIEARNAVAPAYSPTSQSLEVVLGDFSNYLLQEVGDKRNVQIWGNGADFDNVILAALYHAAKLESPWHFYNNRCYRTLKNVVKGPKLVRQGVHHNALDDAKSQAMHAVALLKVVRGEPFEMPLMIAGLGDQGQPTQDEPTASASKRYKRRF